MQNHLASILNEIWLMSNARKKRALPTAMIGKHDELIINFWHEEFQVAGQYKIFREKMLEINSFQL